MADETTPNSKKSNIGWTDTERVGVLFQIIDKMGGKIPWSDLDLPEGRTLKAVQVMVDKEKGKLRKAREANGGTPTTPGKTATPKGQKRDAAGIDDGDAGEPSAKKAKTPRRDKPKKSSAELRETLHSDDFGDLGFLE